MHAVVYCEGGLRSPLGKTTHGLLRYSDRYVIVGVIDSTAAGRDAGTIVGAAATGVPVSPDISTALASSTVPADVLVIGIAPTGYGTTQEIVRVAAEALERGLSVHSGLHYFLGDDEHLRKLADEKGCQILDVRRPPVRPLHMFSGEINSVGVPKLLVTGQDACAGKRTACLRIHHLLNTAGIKSCLIGTGQTARLQGWPYGVCLDALPMDFAAGELEAECLRACEIERPDILIVEGQGSLLNPGYGCETMVLLTAVRPDGFIYVTTPSRDRYDDFPDSPMRSAEEEIDLLLRITRAELLGIIVHADASLQSEVLPSTTYPVPTSYGVDGNLQPIVGQILHMIRKKEPSRPEVTAHDNVD